VTTKKPNFCNSDGLCTIDSDVMQCEYGELISWEYLVNNCKHEKKVGEYEYECLNKEARAEAGAEEL